MERKEILTNYKSINYEGLKLDQSLFDTSEVNKSKLIPGELVSFEDIYFGLISLN